jgi:hypothetical protein
VLLYHSTAATTSAMRLRGARKQLKRWREAKTDASIERSLLVLKWLQPLQRRQLWLPPQLCQAVLRLIACSWLRHLWQLWTLQRQRAVTLLPLRCPLGPLASLHRIHSS